MKAVLVYSLQYTTLLFKYNRLQTDISTYKRLKYECRFFGGASLFRQIILSESNRNKVLAEINKFLNRNTHTQYYSWVLHKSKHYVRIKKQSSIDW